MSNDARRPTARRSFLSQLGVGAAAVGAVAGSVLPAGAQSAGAFQALRHQQDDWLDQIPGKHRLIFDTTTPQSAETARRYATNFFTGNKNGYNVEPADLAVVIILRHDSTPFGYSDAIWAKYGAALSDELKFVDPKTQRAPTVNLHNVAGDTSLDKLSGQGVQFAVCSMATRRLAGILARTAGATADAVFADLSANLVRNGRLVPAGIVALNRAQERGYTYSYVG